MAYSVYWIIKRHYDDRLSVCTWSNQEDRPSDVATRLCIRTTFSHSLMAAYSELVTTAWYSVINMESRLVCYGYYVSARSYGGGIKQCCDPSVRLSVCPVFSARCNIYATMPVSVCLSVCPWRLCIVVTGCNGYRISSHAWINGCLCYLLTTPHPDRRMGWCRDFWWKRGGYGKIGKCSYVTYFTYWESGPETRDSFVYINDADIFIIIRVEEFSLVILVENALYLKNGLC